MYNGKLNTKGGNIMIKEGTKVKWDWGKGTATGIVDEIYKSDVNKTIDGSEVKRSASDSDPAYLIKQDDGQKVLKSSSEVSRAD